MTASPPHRPTLTAVLIAAATLAYTAPLALSRYFPGLDLPFHAVAIRAVHLGGDAGFLGHLTRESGSPSYWLLYGVADAFAYVVRDPVVALQLLVAAYVVTFVASAASLYRAFGAHPVLALLAAPAAYSIAMTYGFFAFAIGYPLAMWTWARLRRAMDEPAGPAPAIAVMGWTLTAAIAHPLVAALTGLGAGVILAAHMSAATRSRIVAVGAAAALGLVPAIVAVVGYGDAATAALPGMMADASVWERFDAQPFVPLSQSIGDAPARLFALAPSGAAPILAIASVAAAAAVALLGGRVARTEPTRLARFAPELLGGALLLLYLATPYNLDAPLVVALQPRLLPLLWVVGLLIARPQPALSRRIALSPAVAVCLAGAVLAWMELAAFATEAGQFRGVASHIPAQTRTLALIEQAPVTDDRPAGPWRHAAAYVMAERGGYASGSFFASGSWLPVARARTGLGLRAPRPGQPRTFDFDAHARGWDMLLIRDADPSERFDYLGDRADRAEPIAERGHWRLYRIARD